MKHIATRVILLFISFIIAIPVGLSMLNPERRCGTGDFLAPLFWMLVFYSIWSIYLAMEGILLHRKNNITKRNANLIMVLIAPMLSFIVWIYFLIIE